jgi:EpsD family peptidyl-prolyl cis-trans isomerase
LTTARDPSAVKNDPYHYRMNRLLAMLPLCAALAACGKSGAPMNPDAISLPELDAVLARSPHVASELAARARERRLDRAPSVLEAVELAKIAVLARAYLQQVAQAQPRPSADEVRHYYAQHPELFAQRRVFSLEEMEVTREAARKAELVAALRDNAAQGASMDAIAGWLHAHDVPHALTRGMRAAEQIPLELLPRLHAMKVGEIEVIDAGGDALFVVRLLAARYAPLDEAAAAPLIEQFLLNRRWSEAISMEIRRQ